MREPVFDRSDCGPGVGRSRHYRGPAVRSASVSLGNPVDVRLVAMMQLWRSEGSDPVGSLPSSFSGADPAAR